MGGKEVKKQASLDGRTIHKGLGKGPRLSKSASIQNEMSQRKRDGPADCENEALVKKASKEDT